MAQVGHKAQGHEMYGGDSIGPKNVAHGLGHKSCPAKRRVRRALERKIRQAGRKACQEF